MAKTSKKPLMIPDEIVINKILLLRDRKVMIDKDSADLYGVSTKRLNEQVKRNTGKFPEGFMFRLPEKEWEKMQLQITPCLVYHQPQDGKRNF